MSGQIIFDQKKCVGCFACYVACISAHYGPMEEEALSCRRIQKVVVPKEGYQKNVCLGCIHCGRCMQECDAGALYRDAETNLVLVRQEKCDGCGKCAEVCPNQVIRIGRDRKVKKCDGCIELRKEGKAPACVSACLTGALTFKKV